jgi:very-short-patch-repair endonuclease
MSDDTCESGRECKAIKAELQETQRKLDDSMRSHAITAEGYAALRARYDTLHRQFTELRNSIERM